jgi:hypothetical protein
MRMRALLYIITMSECTVPYPNVICKKDSQKRFTKMELSEAGFELKAFFVGDWHTTD